jgi:branched-chain amino acid transport system ATP-binding protein
MDSLRLADIAKSFGGLAAVRQITMEIPRGRITGLIGPNGAGKTTVVNMISGINRPSAGTITVGDNLLSKMRAEQIATLGVARTFQNIRLLNKASVRDNIVIGFHKHQRTNWVENLLGFPSVWRERRDFIERTGALLDQFEMRPLAGAMAGALSYGHQRRVEIMRALATAPDFLMLDEPVAGMNAVEAADLGRIFRHLASQGIGILLIEHNVAFVKKVCDYVHVMDAGVLIAAGPAEQVCQDPAVITAYLGA